MISAAAQGNPPADFVLIQGGTFQMGSPESEDWRSDDETLHRVTLSPFYLAKHEVTQRLYREVTGKSPSAFSGDDLPVESVSWLDAVEFCNALSLREGRAPAYTVREGGAQVEWNRSADGYRLPTEAEWEFAARAGTATPFYTQKAPGADDVNFYGRYPYQIEQNYFNDSVLETRPGVYREKTVAAGSFKPNPNGLHDIYGNVGEWCFDYYADYGTSARTDPAGAESGTRRVWRGGGWNGHDARGAGSETRADGQGAHRLLFLGWEHARSRERNPAADRLRHGGACARKTVLNGLQHRPERDAARPAEPGAAEAQDKNRREKMGGVRHDNPRLPQLVGEHPHANRHAARNPRPIGQADSPVLLVWRRTLRAEPHRNRKARPVSGDCRGASSPLLGRRLARKGRGGMAQKNRREVRRK